MPFFIAWFGGLLLVPLVRKSAVVLGLFDRPNKRKIHLQPIPRVGGVAVFFSGFLAAAPFLSQDPKTMGLIVASTIVLLVGLIDDVRDLSPRKKLLGQFFACLVLFYFHVRQKHFYTASHRV